jgi:6-phosphofructokinase 1
MPNKVIKKIVVMTSGGDSPGMNAAIRAVVRAAAFYQIECIGVEMGYEGLILQKTKKMMPRDVAFIINKGGTILQTSRCEAFKTVEGRKKAFETIQQNEIDAMVAIGGDGTFTGAMVFDSEYDFPIIGLPGTIDNDIFGTDATIGYDTALNTAMEAVDKIRDTATSHNRLFFVEVMGRDAGFLALDSGIASGAQDIIIPEIDFDIEKMYENLEKSQSSGKTSNIIIVSEGEKFGDIYEIAKATKEKFPEYDIRVSILGHIQRGGSPSCADRVLASRLGVAAVEGLKEGRRGVMAGIQSNQVVYTTFSDAIKKHNEINNELVRVSKILSI